MIPVHQENGSIPTDRGGRYVSLVAPGGDSPLREGVVLVPPFGEEAKGAVRVYMRLARGLAERGVASLRLDLGGAGDSSGRHADMTWDAWCDDVRAALAWARHYRPATGGWGLLGARMGGLMAAEVASNAGELGPTRLVLVEPVIDGRQYVKELQRRQDIRRMMSGKGSGDEDGPEARWERGKTVDFGGFEVASELGRVLLVRRLDTVLVRKLPPELPIALFRVSASTRLNEAWAVLFESVGQRKNGTAEALRDKPFWGQVEYYESNVVIDAVAKVFEYSVGANDAG